MAEFRVIPLGVGTAFTTRHYTTCLALGAGDAWILVDCSHPVRKMLHEGTRAAGIPFDLDRVSGVALSHLHADHCSGLEDYAFYCYYVLGRRARVLAHPEVSANLWSGTLHGGMGETWEGPEGRTIARQFDEFFDLADLSETQPITFGPFAIECRLTRHTIPTTAFRITALGRVFGFSSDTGWDPSLIEWLAPADLIVHEVTTIASSVHTPYEHLATLPEPLRRKMRLNHYPDDFDLEPRAIEILQQGKCYTI
jgi:ribonuclease BN (tRNA processing enzyme)